MKETCPTCRGCFTRRHDFRTYRKISLSGMESKGYQRWFCLTCKRPFIPVELKRDTVSPYDTEVREQATILYIDTGGSYRAVMRQLRQWGLPHVQTWQVWQWIQEVGQQCMDPFTLSQRVHPQWTGWLEVDGDRLRVGDQEVSILLAMDVETRDVPCAILGREHVYDFTRLFQQLKALDYPLKGLTSDGAGVIAKAYRKVFPQGLHQRCTVHLARTFDEWLQPHYATFPHLPSEYQRFQRAFHGFAEAPTWQEALPYLKFLLRYPSFQRPAFQMAREVLIQTLPQLTPGFFHPAMPRTNNLIENLIRFLDRRLTPMDRFHSSESAWSILKLLILFYRFHKFDNPSKAYRHIKDRSPLELAGVDTHRLFWLSVGTHSQKHTQS